MNFGSPEFVLAIIGMATFAGIVKTSIRAKHGMPDFPGGGRRARRERSAEADSPALVESLKHENKRLTDQVELVGPPTPAGDRTRFSTANLQIFPKQDLALSQDRVTISRADSILRGPGLRADMRSKHIQLLDDVKGRYAPPPP